MDWSRREFCRGVVAGIAGGVATARATGDADVGEKIVDTHQHLWDLGRFRLPWLDRAEGKLKRNYLPEDYARDAEGLNVALAVYMEVEVTPEQHEAEAKYVIDLCERGSGVTVAGVIGGEPAKEGFDRYIAKYKGSAVVKGVRSVYPKGGAENEQYLKSLRLLGEIGMSYDLLMNGPLLGEGAKVAGSCPGTRFILDHCGNASTRFFGPGAGEDATLMKGRRAWEEGVARLAEQKNVVCKISGVAETGSAELATVEAMGPIIDGCIDRFGEERVMFASNWPVCLKTVTYARWVELLKQIVKGRGEGFRRKLFSENAAKFYGIQA